MKADFFIDRPVFSTVLSIIIVIVGAIGLALLPVDQYPQIVPPVVRVSASYPGADAQTVTQAVATPIEQELNGTPGMIYMESSSSNSGGFSATVTFDISVDPDLAAVDVQNRLKKAEARLPAEVVQNGISVEKQAASKLMTITLLSSDPKFDEIYLSNYATLNVLVVSVRHCDLMAMQTEHIFRAQAGICVAISANQINRSFHHKADFLGGIPDITEME